MRTKIMITALLGFLFLGLSAQTDDYQDRRHRKRQLTEQEREKIKKRVESIRVQRLTDELNLSPEDAQKFWPVYNQFRKEMDEAQNPMWEKFSRGKQDLSGMSDQEIDNLVAMGFTHVRKVASIKEKYYAKFKEIIGTQRAAKMFLIERKLQKELIRRAGRYQKDY